MGYGKKWRPSKTAAREFAQKMDEIQVFCNDHGIDYSRSLDSFYFTVNNQRYRVSNHSIEKSNAGAVSWTGEKIRDNYHDSKRSADIVYIHASKTRLIDIYNDLYAGYELDGRGFRK